jgi:hypothetical protein
MPSKKYHHVPSADPRCSNYPALVAVRLSASDLNELARQGFVCAERRNNKSYFKLRFRQNGKQVVRYIGDAERACQVLEELDALQAEAKSLRRLRAMVKYAKAKLREVKLEVIPILEANGLVFHGLSIRRPRT